MDVLAGFSRGLRIRTRELACGLTEPGFEARLSEPCAIVGNQCSLADHCPGVKCSRVSDNFTGISECSQSPAHELVDAKLFRPSDFDSAIYRGTYRDLGHSAGNIVGCHRLEKHRWQMHFSFYDRNVGKALEEFEKLRRVDDRVRDQRLFDQDFLSHFGAEVTTFEQKLGSY